MNHDPGTPGSATGTTTYPVTNPADGTTCRQFKFTLTAGGGEIYHVKALTDSSAYDTFCYETVESSPDWSNVACAEKDMEQADSTGAYVDMATQLDGHRGVVDITESGRWVGTSVAANPMKRAANVLHTTRVYVQNLGAGKVLYIGIFLDGTYYPLGISATSSPTDKWGDNVLNVQLQYDGLSSGSVESTVYMSVLNIHCWKSSAAPAPTAPTPTTTAPAPKTTAPAITSAYASAIEGTSGLVAYFRLGEARGQKAYTRPPRRWPGR